MERNPANSYVPETEKPASPKSVLLADDNIGLVKVWKRALERENFIVDMAFNGREALEKIIKTPYSVVFSDLDMPEMNGVALTKAVRDQRIETCLNIITGKGTIDSSVECMRNGACDYLTKPVDLSELSALAYRCLIHQQLREEKRNLLSQIRHWEDLNILKSEFVSNVSHELRTPLFSLGTAFEFLLDEIKGKLDPRQMELGTVISQNYQRLFDLVTRVFNFSRLERGRLKPDLSNLNLTEAIKKTIDSLSPLFNKYELKITLQMPSTAVFLEMDADMMDQILTNLLGNAIKFTESGGKIGVDLTEGENGVEIAVWDTGRGIPADKLDLVFNRFFQVDSGTTRATGGAGIGLSLVKSFVELHGGKISVTSQEGRGSRFVIAIPKKMKTEIEKEASHG